MDEGIDPKHRDGAGMSGDRVHSLLHDIGSGGCRKDKTLGGIAVPCVGNEAVKAYNMELCAADPLLPTPEGPFLCSFLSRNTFNMLMRGLTRRSVCIMV